MPVAGLSVYSPTAGDHNDEATDAENHIERMHLPDPTPDNHVETRFEADGAGTLMTMRMTLPDEGTRDAMLATGMDEGMEASYQRLERSEFIQIHSKGN